MHRPELADQILNFLLNANKWVFGAVLAKELNVPVGVILQMMDRIHAYDNSWIQIEDFSRGRLRYQIRSTGKTAVIDFLQSGGFTDDYLRTSQIQQKKMENEKLYESSLKAAIEQASTMQRIREETKAERIKADQAAKTAKFWTIVSAVSAVASAIAALFALKK